MFTFLLNNIYMFINRSLFQNIVWFVPISRDCYLKMNPIQNLPYSWADWIIIFIT